MQYTGQSAYVPQTAKTIPAGDYAFIVGNAEEKESQSGNPMISLELLVAIPDRDPMKIFDHLVFMDAALFKIEQFCKAVGMPERFQIGVNGLPAIDISGVDCLNKQGLAHLVVGDKGYMVVKWYVDSEKAKKPAGVYQASPAGVRPPMPQATARPAVPVNRPPMPQARPLTPPPAKVAFTPPPAAPEPTAPEIPDAPLEDDNFNPDDIPF